jgi:hypothetical protein
MNRWRTAAWMLTITGLTAFATTGILSALAAITHTGPYATAPVAGAPAAALAPDALTAPSTAQAVTPSTPSAQQASNITCNYQEDTWSGDASQVGYTVSKLSANNGNPASMSVNINANSGTTEVVGYPSLQCLMYSAIPSSLTSSFKVTPPASSAGLDYEFAYDVWLTSASNAKASNWNNDLELMIWTYVAGQTPAGSVAATLADGSKVWIDGDNSTGIVSVVLPQNKLSGTVNISGLISELKARGYINSDHDGILDVEYGIEAPYGGGQTFTVDSLSVSG